MSFEACSGCFAISIAERNVVDSPDFGSIECHQISWRHGRLYKLGDQRTRGTKADGLRRPNGRRGLEYSRCAAGREYRVRLCRPFVRVWVEERLLRSYTLAIT